MPLSPTQPTQHFIRGEIMPWTKVSNTNDNEERYEKTHTHRYKRQTTINDLLDELKRIDDEIAHLQEERAKIQADYDEIMSIKGE